MPDDIAIGRAAEHLHEISAAGESGDLEGLVIFLHR
jgi:hypothetical protein